MTDAAMFPRSHPYTYHVDTWPTMADTHAATATANGNNAEMSWLGREGSRVLNVSYGWIGIDVSHVEFRSVLAITYLNAILSICTVAVMIHSYSP